MGLYILGDSHIYAVQMALKQRMETRGLTSAEERMVVSRFAKAKNGGMIAGLTEDGAIEMIQRDPDAVVIAMIGGNQFNMFGMMQHQIPFDFFEPSLAEVPLREDARIIPLQLMEQVFAGLSKGREAQISGRLRSCFAGPMFHVVPPPPKEDDAFVLQNAETYFRERSIETIGVSPALLRLKLWKLQIRLAERFYPDKGIAVLGPPPQALSGPGFLAPAFYGRDATHANAAYGDLMLDIMMDAALKTEALSS